jgi:hypothetical protein
MDFVTVIETSSIDNLLDPITIKTYSYISANVPTAHDRTQSEPELL